MEYRHEIMNMADYTIEHELIEDMNENIFTELDCSKKYVMDALRHKSEDRTIADKELAMCAEELGHANMIMNKIEKILASMEEQKHQCYEWLALSWYYTKHRVMGYMDWIKSLHEKYKK